MVTSFFTPEAVNAMKPEIQKKVNSLLDEMIKKGCKEPVDFIECFALPVPSLVSETVQKSWSAQCTSDGDQTMYNILGVPAKDMKYLTEMNAVRTNGSSTAAAAANANQ